MSKSIKLKNNNYWDSSSISHNHKILSDILLEGTLDANWNKSKTISYKSNFKPMLICIHWSQSEILYIFYYYKLFVIASDIKSGDTISYNIDTENKNINFTLSNTGISYYITAP